MQLHKKQKVIPKGSIVDTLLWKALQKVLCVCCSP